MRWWQYGGAIYSDGGELTLTNCTLTNNTATTSGHALFFELSTVALLDSTFEAGDAPPGILISTSVAIDWGTCAPGTTPGAAATNVRVEDGDFSGCPFRCPIGTYGPGGTTAALAVGAADQAPR